MTHQEALDSLIAEIMPSPLLENNLEILEKDLSFLNHRLTRLRAARRHLEKRKPRTEKESLCLNRYKNRIKRLSTVLYSKEHLVSVARFRRLNGRS
jgi:hypothetical protein